jgi:hypothetical protein
MSGSFYQWCRRFLAGRDVGLLGHGLRPGPFGAMPEQGPGLREVGLMAPHRNRTPITAAAFLALITGPHP